MTINFQNSLINYKINFIFDYLILISLAIKFFGTRVFGICSNDLTNYLKFLRLYFYLVLYLITNISTIFKIIGFKSDT